MTEKLTFSIGSGRTQNLNSINQSNCILNVSLHCLVEISGVTLTHRLFTSPCRAEVQQRNKTQHAVLVTLAKKCIKRKKVSKVLPYLLPSVGPGADPGVQAVSPHVTISHPPGGRLPLLSARPAVTFPVEERHRPSAGTKLYCLVTDAHACEQLAQSCYLKVYTV